jgi:aminomethyltransferase
VVQDLFGDKVLELAYYELMETDLNGIPVVVARTGWTGEVGYEIYLRDHARGDELWEAVMEAGRPYNIAPTGASHIRRVEAGILSYGFDMTSEDNPFELTLGWLVDLDQEADFIGKEALKRIKAEGIKRKLVGVEVHSALLPSPNEHWRWPVSRDGERIGDLRSIAYSPRLGKIVGYAMVPIKYADLGTELTVETSDFKAMMTVVQKPFYDPKKEIPKS